MRCRWLKVGMQGGEICVTLAIRGADGTAGLSESWAKLTICPSTAY